MRTLTLFCIVLLGTPLTLAESAGKQPGALDYTDALRTQLEAALAKKGSDYVPRTHHQNEDGSPQFTNRLILENSPYLIQHAHNPVDWYPWGDEAFEKARELDRPVLLSVGYSTCHWCHVMEKESFEDLEIAEYINQHYIAIKVDRERRPDVDGIYMAAVRRLSGRGGWPMTVAMTPDRKPFFGGTYFPARDGDRGARKGFLTILKDIQERYTNDREMLVNHAESTSRRIQQDSQRIRPTEVPTATALSQAVESLKKAFDETYGGFRFGRTKFPRPVTLDLLLHYWRRSSDAQALHMVTYSLNKMADGGIYDHVAGGFHRYATERTWLIPHFEKMLYDNGQLANIYLDAFQVVDHPKAERIVTEVLEYVLREMTSPNGAFFSATDADSVGPSGHQEEGYYFTWTLKELHETLSVEEFEAIISYHNVTKRGNFERRNILAANQPIESVAAGLATTPAVLRARLTNAYKKLYTERQKRPAPIRDDKVIVSWNGLMISAFARAGQILGKEHYTQSARRSAAFILHNMRAAEGKLYRVYLDGSASHDAVINDYGFFIAGLIDLFESTQELRWLEEAIALQKTVDRDFVDEEKGGYFFASKDASGLLFREKQTFDAAIPTGNSYTTRNLLRLYEYTQNSDYRKAAEKSLQAMGSILEQGSSLAYMLIALDHYLDQPKQIIIVKPDNSADATPFLKVLAKQYLPNRMVVVVNQSDVAKFAKRIPLVADKIAKDGKVTAYVCVEGVCELPTNDPKVFAQQIATTTTYMVR